MIAVVIVVVVIVAVVVILRVGGHTTLVPNFLSQPVLFVYLQTRAFVSVCGWLCTHTGACVCVCSSA